MLHKNHVPQAREDFWSSSVETLGSFGFPLCQESFAGRALIGARLVKGLSE